MAWALQNLPFDLQSLFGSVSLPNIHNSIFPYFTCDRLGRWPWTPVRFPLLIGISAAARWRGGALLWSVGVRACVCACAYACACVRVYMALANWFHKVARGSLRIWVEQAVPGVFPTRRAQAWGWRVVLVLASISCEVTGRCPYFCVCFPSVQWEF